LSIHRAFSRVSVILVGGLLLAACGGSAAPASSAPAASASSKPAAASPSAASAKPSAPASAKPATSASAKPAGSAAAVPGPNLKGMDFKMTLGAGAPHVADSETYIVVQMLKKWGATANLTLGSGNTPTLAVVSGQEEVVAQGLSEMINAGLTIIGPNQPHVDYVMVSKSLKSVDQLPGHTFGLGGTKQGIDAVLLHAVLALHKIPVDKVQEVEIGSVANAVNAMIAGKLDAAFIHADTVKKAQQQGGLNILATASKDVSWSADSFMAAKPDWLKANHAKAVAIDEAYLAAAKIFNNDPKQWIAYAQEYTQHANTDQVISDAHDLFKTSNLWPDDAAAYSAAVLQRNWDAANTMKDIQGRGNRPLAQWSDVTAWQEAAKAMLQ